MERVFDVPAPPDVVAPSEDESVSDPFSTAFEAHLGVLRRTERDLAIGFSRLLSACRRMMSVQGKLLIFGNGGSAADAQHIAAELVVRFRRDRAAIAAVALTTDTSILTAAANDIGYDQVFARQIEALSRPGDLVLGITTSGRSRNVLAGLRRARDLGVETAVLTGSGGACLSQEADHVLAVPSESTARIQEMHLILAHALCDGMERHRMSLSS